MIDSHKFRTLFITSDDWLRRTRQAESPVKNDHTAELMPTLVSEEIYWNEGLVDNDDLDYLDLDLEVARIENRSDVSLEMPASEEIHLNKISGQEDIIILESQIIKKADAIEAVEEIQITTSTTTKRKLICETCSKELPNKISLKRHQINQHKDKPTVLKKAMGGKPDVQVTNSTPHGRFVCDTCSKVLPNETSLNRHQKYHRKDKSKCPLCTKLFSHSSNLKRHILMHRSEKSLDCDKCPKTFNQPAALYEHMKDHRSDPSTTTKETLSSVKHYIMHCEMCSEETESFAMFAKHMRKQHGITDRSQIKPFKCEVCAMHFASKQGMNRHIDNIHENNRRNLRSRDKNFLCNTCGKNFFTNFHLDVHIRSHTGERPFKCQFCNKAFAQMSGLKMHTFTHTGERPFMCSKCPKTFNQYGHVREHMMTHSSDRPHVCPVCDRSFRVKGNLTAHMLIHSGKKPYTCEHCGRRFRKSTLLLRHVEKKHTTTESTSGESKFS